MHMILLNINNGNNVVNINVVIDSLKMDIVASLFETTVDASLFVQLSKFTCLLHYCLSLTSISLPLTWVASRVISMSRVA